MIWHRNDAGIWKDKMLGIYGNNPDYLVGDCDVVHKSHGVVERFEIEIPGDPRPTTAPRRENHGSDSSLFGKLLFVVGILYLLVKTL